MKIHSIHQPINCYEPWRSPDLTKMVTLDSDYKLFKCISISPNQVFDTGMQKEFDPKKIQIEHGKPDFYIDDYTFSQSGRYFLGSDRKNLSVVDLGSFE
jgi:hypothetical protein